MTTDQPNAEPQMTLVRPLDVRRADKDLDGLADWITDVLRREPGRLIDLSTYEDGGNRIRVRIDAGREKTQ